jgi:hypothetical protein
MDRGGTVFDVFSGTSSIQPAFPVPLQVWYSQRRACAEPSEDRRGIGVLEALFMAEITIAWGIDDTLEAETERGKRVFASLVGSVILQAMALGIVFSLDSAITSVGMASELSVRLTAIGFAVGGMLFFAETMSRFVEEHLFYDGLRFSG